MLTKELTTKIKRTERSLKKLQEQRNEYKKLILEELKENGLNEKMINGLLLKLKDSYERLEFNEEEFKNDHPNLYSKYLKETTVRESLSIKVL